MTTRYDLGAERWVPVRTHDGEAAEVSLRDALVHADRYACVAGESPTMTAAILRLLIAIVYRALWTVDEGTPVTMSSWAELWRAGRLPVEPIERYLERVGPRLDLFGDEPFMQCPELADVKASSVALLVPYLANGSNVTLFDHTSATGTVRLTPARAARWLVTVQSADPGGLKTPFPGHPKSSSGAPCATGAVLLFDGGTLARTVLLNLGEYDPDSELPSGTRAGDAPAWERPVPPGVPRQRNPLGITDLLTYQARRVLLRPVTAVDGSVVVEQVTICPGDVFTASFQPNEPHMAFVGKDGEKHALRMDQYRALWRNSLALFAGNKDRPHSFRWLARLEGRELLELPELVPVSAFGQVLSQAKFVAWAAEQVRLPSRLLAIQSGPEIELLKSALSLAEQVGRNLTGAARDYRKKRHAETPPNWRPRELDTYWPPLSPAFDRLVSELAPGELDADALAGARHRWADTVQAAADRARQAFLNPGTTTARDLSIRTRISDATAYFISRSIKAFRNGGEASS